MIGIVAKIKENSLKIRGEMLMTVIKERAVEMIKRILKEFIKLSP